LPFSDAIAKQFNKTESDLQPQAQDLIGNASQVVDEAKGKPWPLSLEIEFANRYVGALTGSDMDTT
jgi:hypothetical protein